MWIEDLEHPRTQGEECTEDNAYSDTHNDYALATRTRDPLPGQISVEIADPGAARKAGRC